nr:9330_t:CDS:2 [Entrophospora candida]
MEFDVTDSFTPTPTTTELPQRPQNHKDLIELTSYVVMKLKMGAYGGFERPIEDSTMCIIQSRSCIEGIRLASLNLADI